MLKYVTTGFFLIASTTLALADENQPAHIDLSTPSNHSIVVEDHQSVQPTTLDEKFAPENPLGDTQFNLSYGEEERVEDEYGLIRDQPSNQAGQTPTE